MKNMKTVAQVYQTTDYNGLQTTKGNRDVNKLHVERLKKSFRENYLLSPILINEKDEIIDGQHRYQAARELGLPINIICVNGYGLKEVQLLNTNMKNWGKVDYLKAFCDLGYSEYLKFRIFMRRFKELPIASCEVLLTQRLGFSSTNRKNFHNGAQYRTRYFEEGELVIKNYEQSIEYAERIMQIKPYYDGYHRRVFVVAMMGVFLNESYSHPQFLQKLQTNPGALQHCNNVTQYKLMIEDIYNYRSRQKVSLRF